MIVLPKSEEYDESYYSTNMQSGDRIALRFYRRLISSHIKKGRVLDYGCGTGHLIKRFGKGFEAWAYDVSDYALRSVRKKAPSVRICTDESSLPKNSFDIIVSLHVLEHLEDPESKILFLASLLKKNGVLLFVVPNISGLGHKIKKHKWIGYGDHTHISLHPSQTWKEWTRSSGLEIIRTGTDGLWDVPYLKRVPLVIQKLIFYTGPALQFIAGQLIFPDDWGESLIVIARKK